MSEISQPTSAQRARGLLRRGLPLGLGLVCLWLLSSRLQTVDLAAIGVLLTEVSPLQWAIALGMTVISFQAIGQFDVIAHRHMGTGVAPRRALVTGAAATAMAQAAGGGLLTAGAMRWRLLPGLTPGQIARLTGLTGLAFLTALALVTGAAVPLVLTGVHAFWALAVPVCLVLAAAAVFLHPSPRLFGRPQRLFSLPACAAILGITLIDTMGAAAALYVFLPVVSRPDPATFYAVYLLALGVAMLAATPGGLGPFELILLAALPAVPEAELLSAIVAFRLVYYALPALWAGWIALRPYKGGDLPQVLAPPTTPSVDPAGTEASAVWLHKDGQSAAVLRLPQTACLIVGADHGGVAPLLPLLRAQARAENRVASLWKIAPRDARAARRAGWRVLPVADHAVIAPQGFSTAGPARSGLRHALQKAEAAGVRVRRIDPGTQGAALAAIGTTPAQDCGCDGDHALSPFHQRPGDAAPGIVFGAWQGDRLVAFAAFHGHPREWALDRIARAEGCPEGAAHALLETAIRQAAAEDVPRLSLGAVPLRWRRARTRNRRHGCHACFAPRWERRYFAAPGWAALVLAGLDLWRDAHSRKDVKAAHHDHADYEFASQSQL
ncbi:phosphatidylglycerol lysyltransferase domain-containing protein [Aestuariicoccus sp. MJ-SS9]|uniref:phosphatidylglycerol lysyltransferase domain-containing protein n=1 Tax=Aestuariicoccus sp. MJ-SS9 TaxID=3079855 RepID=UPI00290A0CFA|nr:phosphatidylglycerol lysyltransferase domain-containing protein [Aestuariicoccus sp. MJ-SS9]MDU8911467.1 phosphatidylglycerol lysyltransferase domain-containing protein [Aestuariicoccus sp. MJ-SS9]